MHGIKKGTLGPRTALALVLLRFAGGCICLRWGWLRMQPTFETLFSTPGCPPGA